MSTSYLETVRSAMDTALSAIVAGATYRNTVSEVYQRYEPEKIKTYPSITLLFWSARLQAKDDSWSVYDIYIPFVIVCHIKANTDISATSNLVSAQDSLIHDVFKVIANLYTANINSNAPKWNIRNDPSITISPIFPTGENTGEFAISGEIHIRNMNNSFSD